MQRQDCLCRKALWEVLHAVHDPCQLPGRRELPEGDLEQPRGAVVEDPDPLPRVARGVPAVAQATRARGRRARGRARRVCPRRRHGKLPLELGTIEVHGLADAGPDALWFHALGERPEEWAQAGPLRVLFIGLLTAGAVDGGLRQPEPGAEPELRRQACRRLAGRRPLARRRALAQGCLARRREALARWGALARRGLGRAALARRGRARLGRAALAHRRGGLAWGRGPFRDRRGSLPRGRRELA
mmetsp:Transcript_3718/g.10244  ORF Transcript_3718/g.10244 Transcript_3718/m.10244 type:complete len:244 (+) Transcript_3718:1733-2464(+)